MTYKNLSCFGLIYLTPHIKVFIIQGLKNALHYGRDLGFRRVPNSERGAKTGMETEYEITKTCEEKSEILN